VSYPIAYALIGGLSADSVVKHPEALQRFPEVKLVDFDSATKEALEKTHPSSIERVWEDGKDFGSLSIDNPNGKASSQTSEVWRTLKHEGCFVDYRKVQANATLERVIGALKQVVNESRNFTVVDQSGESFIVHAKDQWAGEKWIEWQISRVGNKTLLFQTVFFCPRGLPGFLYWYLLYPFHWLRFRGLIRNITKQSENNEA
jgi:hypothetical protein